MSLFIGNVSNTITTSEFARYFEEFGKCEIKMKGSFAFVDYEEEDAADNAMDKLKGKVIGGRKINIEYSKKSKKFVPSQNPSKRKSSSHSKERDPIQKKCFNCHLIGHFIRDCPKKIENNSFNRHRSRTRSRDRRRRSRSRSRSGSRDRKHRRRRHSDSNSQSRSRSRSRRRDSERDRRNKRRYRSKYSKSPEDNNDNSDVANHKERNYDKDYKDKDKRY